jgi:predicted RNase H-like nuclease (RuvC/YqgF family)
VHELENQNRALENANEKNKTKILELEGDHNINIDVVNKFIAKNNELSHNSERFKKISEDHQRELVDLKKTIKEFKSSDVSKTQRIQLLTFELNEIQTRNQELQRDIEMERQTRDTNFSKNENQKYVLMLIMFSSRYHSQVF